MVNKDFVQFKKSKQQFVCQFSSDYTCLICNKHVYYGQKGVLCSGCNFWVHQKCAGLTNLQYKVLSCQKLKFPFAALSNHDIQKDSFNSLFQCKCQTTLPTDIADNKYILNYHFYEYKDKPGNNMMDLNDKELYKNSIQPNFQYYQNSEFHKLSQNLKRNKTFSILHTNICSVNENLENLELLLNNLEHSFDIISF